MGCSLQQLRFEELTRDLPQAETLISWEEIHSDGQNAVLTPRVPPALHHALLQEANLLGISANQLYKLKLNLALRIEPAPPPQ